MWPLLVKLSIELVIYALVSYARNSSVLLMLVKIVHVDMPMGKSGE